MSFGSPPSGYRRPTSDPTARRDGTISLVSGIVGLFILSIILGPVAIVFGLRGRRGGAGGVATAGFVLGILDVVFWLIGMIVLSANGFYGW